MFEAFDAKGEFVPTPIGAAPGKFETLATRIDTYGGMIEALRGVSPVADQLAATLVAPDGDPADADVPETGDGGEDAAAIRARLDMFAAHVAGALAFDVDAVAEAVAAVAIHLARAIVGAELSLRPEAVTDRARAALGMLVAGDAAATVFVNPDDEQWFADWPSSHGIDIVPDASVPPGGFELRRGEQAIFDTLAARIDAFLPAAS